MNTQNFEMRELLKISICVLCLSICGTGYTGHWELLTIVSRWSPPADFVFLQHNDQLWLFGDRLVSNSRLVSSDGITWQFRNEKPPWWNRTLLLGFVHNEYIWLAGGNGYWRSRDGDEWESVSYASDWYSIPGGYLSAIAQFEDKIFMSGGFYSYVEPCKEGPTCEFSFTLGTVFESEDAFYWKNNFGELFEGAPWPSRCMHSSVVFNDKIWIFGGMSLEEHSPIAQYSNDVWCSSDGKNWSQVNANAPWCPRYNHSSIVFDNKMWILGGKISGNKTTNDVWTSTDGIQWILESSCAPWLPRAGHKCLVVQEKLLLVGGNARIAGAGTSYYNDIWVYSLEGEHEEVIQSPNVHSADNDYNIEISLSELLQVIQFYNSGGYHWLPTGDGPYGAGRSEEECTCPPHSTDYNPQDWTISLRELLRLIQFYNSNGYHLCPDAEDGFCPGLE